MSDIQFDTPDNEFGPSRGAEVHKADMVDRIVGWGIVSTRDQAQYALVGFVAASLVLGYLIMHMGGGSSGTTKIPREQMDAVMQNTMQQQQAPVQYGN